MKKDGSPDELLTWLKINMEYTQNTIIDLNLAIHNLKISGKDDLNLDNVLRMSETYLKKYLRAQEEEYSELLQSHKLRPKFNGRIYQFCRKEQ